MRNPFARKIAATVATPGDIGLDPQGRVLHTQEQSRAPARFSRMYDGARLSRLTSDWSAPNTSADSELVASLTNLRSRSRQVCRDVSYAKRARTLFVNNIIGQGIGMQAQVYTVRDELNARVNTEIESVWEEWSEAGSCHTGGRFDFAAFERTLMAQLFEAGEVFVRKHGKAFGDSKIPFALELIEAERIADQLDTTGVPVMAGNQLRMGIEVDRYFRPVAYFIRAWHPSEFRFNTMPNEVERVPADEIIHLAVGDRWPQTRGEPMMASVLRTFKDVAGYVEAEITRARIQASTPWTIETPENTNSLGEQQLDGSVEMAVEPGVAKRLNPGEKMNAPNTNSPNPAIEPFLRYFLRDAASGTNVNYGSLSGDLSQSNYSSSRLAMLDDRDVWRIFQSWLICSFREPIHKEWMLRASLAGAFSTFTVAQYATDMDKFNGVRFRPRGWGWVDPTKEVQSYKDAVRCGFMTLADVAAANGEDLEELFEQRAKEVAMAEEAGLVFDTDPSQVANTGKAQADNTVVNTPTDQGGTPADTPPANSQASDQPNEPGSGRVLRFER